MVQYFKHLLPTLTLFWGLFSTAVSFAAYFALPIVFGEEFAETTQPFWILFANSTLIFPLLAGYGSLSGSSSATYIPMLSAIFAGSVNICFNFLLIPKFGILGCAWATAIMYFVNSFTLAVLLRRHVKIPISWTFIAPFPAVCGAVSFTLTQNPWWSLAVCLSLSIFVTYFQNTSFQETLTFLKRYRTKLDK